MPPPLSSHVFLDAVRAGALALPVHGKRLIVAFSGGLDSTVLLHALARLRSTQGFVLEAAHVHHGLNVRADDWLRHCQAVCEQLDVPFHGLRVQVATDGRGLEAAAREARHAALAALPCDWCVLAHHRADQAETVLHRLLRGAGVHGASAMHETDAARRLWRPLLAFGRDTLQACADAWGVAWVEDDSNNDLALTRNYLRHRVLPTMAAHFPAAEPNLARAAAHFAEAAGLLEELAGADAERVCLGSDAARARLTSLSAARQRNLLRHWLAERGARMPDSARLDDALRQLAGDAAVRIPLDGVVLCAYRTRIWLASCDENAPQARVWHGERVLPWGAGSVHFTPVEGAGGLALRAGATTLDGARMVDRLRPRTDGPSRPFRLLCQEQGVAPWLRPAVPALRVDGELAWLGCGGAAASLATGEGGWRVEWMPRADDRPGLGLDP
ncbi:MAG: tRNA lysidine(34) synthetase TilS [Rhodocyclaceae bacterium]